MDGFLKDFNTVDKAKWIEKVIKDLKGKSIEGLNTEITPGVNITPFHHSDDKAKATILTQSRTQNTWLPAHIFHVTNVKKDNQKALDALMGGIASLHFVFSTLPSAQDMETLLHDIDLGLIHTHFEVTQSAAVSSGLLKAIAPLGSTINGSWKGISNPELVAQHLPNFTVAIIDDMQQDTPIDGLAHLIQSGKTLLDNQGQEVAKKLAFQIKIDENYFVSIAKIRALRLLWANVLKAYGIPVSTYPRIIALCTASTQDHDYKGMISATGMALSAAVGGADEIALITPSDIAEEELSHHYRISRNVHHLLTMESFIDRVNDPAAGSYYIEHLTDELCQKAWTKFQQV